MKRLTWRTTWFGLLGSCSSLMAIFILFHGPPSKGPYTALRTDNVVMPAHKIVREVGEFTKDEDRTNDDVMHLQNTFSKLEAVVDDILGNNKEGAPPQTISCQTHCDQTSKLSTIGDMPGWTDRILPNNISKYDTFRPRLTQLEYNQTVELYAEFRRIFQQHNLTYFLYGGTLLGAYRHFGLVPWYDDIDVMMNGSQRLQIKTVLSRVPGYELRSPPDHPWKFFKKFTRKPSVNKMWPFIDFFFFAENSTHIWDDHPPYTQTFCFNKGDVFPLTTTLFENTLAPVPRHTKTFLTTNYNLDRCNVRPFSHKLRPSTIYKGTVTPCQELFQYFPFVFRVSESGYSSERLVKNNQTLLTVKSKC